jgi:protein-tyrosine kinase
MGKIFDALERAENQHAKTVPLTKPSLEQQNVITIANSGKTAKENRLDPSLVVYHAPQSLEAETFKVLRTGLLFPADGSPHKKILVTGPTPGDGKSFVASNLAISIAMGIEEHVLLIDCDLRKPAIHTRFGFGQTGGLSEYLTTESTLDKFLLKSAVPKLTILPAGRPPSNPTELLTSKKMKSLVDEVAGRYDDRFIVIDSPPPLLAAETKALVNLMDGVILVVKSGSTPKSAVTEAVEQIGKEKLIGIVFNCSLHAAKKYYDYGKAYYQHKQD